MSTQCQVAFCERDVLKHFNAVTEIAAILEDHKRADHQFSSQQEANEFFHGSCRKLENVPDWLLFELLAVLEKLPEPQTILLGKS